MGEIEEGNGPQPQRTEKPHNIQIMAILNVTPDSFSDGGRLFGLDAIVEAAGNALAHGADMLDIGGESTRPGAETVAAEVELERVIPAIDAIRKAFPQAVISIDTRKASVAEAACRAGASIVNDVSGLQFDPAMPSVVANAGAQLVLMHSQGTPETMQRNPHYPQGVVVEVDAFFERQIALATDAGILRESLILDPGFGFGKTVAHNLALLNNLSSLKHFNLPILAGVSRKSFLTLGCPEAVPPAQREALTATANVLAIQNGAGILRVHDVATQAPAIRLTEAALFPMTFVKV